MKRILLIIVLAISSQFATGQGATDAFRFSQVSPGGTARFTSMGGAFGALGGDFSSLSINPAGLGVFRGFEFIISPELQLSNIATTYYGDRMEDMDYNLNLNNLGVVMAIRTGHNSDAPGIRFINLGFGINRHNNFNHRWIASGFNNESSLMTSFLEQAIREGSINNLDNFSTGLAWDTHLLDRIDGQFFVDMPNGNVQQTRMNQTSGSVREFVASAAVNYNDQLFFGLTVGLPTIDFSENFQFEESDINNQSVYFNSLEYKYNLSTWGSGLNFKIGAIFRASNMLRLGAAFHSPTFYTLEDEFSASMRSSLTLAEYNNFANSPTGRFSYELHTPFRLIGSIALIFGQSGLISLDYEHTDFSTMRLRSDSYSFIQENQSIKDSFTSQQIIRIGGEYRLNPVTLRAGIMNYSNPFQDGINDASRTVFSLGVGFSQRNFFLDLGYTSTVFSEDFYPYDSNLVRPISKNYQLNGIKATLGLRF